MYIGVPGRGVVWDVWWPGPYYTVGCVLFSTTGSQGPNKAIRLRKEMIMDSIRGHGRMLCRHLLKLLASLVSPAVVQNAGVWTSTVFGCACSTASHRLDRGLDLVCNRLWLQTLTVRPLVHVTKRRAIEKAKVLPHVRLALGSSKAQPTERQGTHWHNGRTAKTSSRGHRNGNPPGLCE